jgi:hypothetical protein
VERIVTILDCRVNALRLPPNYRIARRSDSTQSTKRFGPHGLENRVSRMLTFLRRRRFGRAVVLGAVLLAHLYVIPLMLGLRAPHSVSHSSERMMVTFISLPSAADEPQENSRARVAESSAVHARRDSRRTSSAITAPTDTVATDWLGAAQRAAAAIATDEAPNLRTFGMPASGESPKPKQKPFDWDKTHTQRFEALPEGGILIRLSDRCQLVLAPLPLGGCMVGETAVRGDLFDEMKAPTELGDWKDTGPP